MKQPCLDTESLGDTQLIDLLGSEETVALPELYARYGQALSNVAMQVLHDGADAEEVIQDVFLQLTRQYSRYAAQKGSALTWLATLTRRRAIDKVRQRSAYQRAKTRLETQRRHAGENAVHPLLTDHAAERSDLRHFLEALLAQLPPPQRLVIEYAFFGGMTQRQIAASTKTPLGTVKTRIESGLRRLFQSTAHLREKIA